MLGPVIGSWPLFPCARAAIHYVGSRGTTDGCVTLTFLLTIWTRVAFSMTVGGASQLKLHLAHRFFIRKSLAGYMDLWRCVSSLRHMLTITVASSMKRAYTDAAGGVHDDLADSDGVITFSENRTVERLDDATAHYYHDWCADQRFDALLRTQFLSTIFSGVTRELFPCFYRCNVHVLFRAVLSVPCIVSSDDICTICKEEHSHDWVELPCRMRHKFHRVCALRHLLLFDFDGETPRPSRCCPVCHDAVVPI